MFMTEFSLGVLMIIYNACFLLIYFFYHKQKLTFPCTEYLEVWKFPKLASNWEAPIYEYSSIIEDKLGTMFSKSTILEDIYKSVSSKNDLYGVDSGHW